MKTTNENVTNRLNHKNFGAGIGAFCVNKLRDGYSAKEVLELVHDTFPLAVTTMKCVYWYASKNGIALRREAKATTPKVVKAPAPKMGEVITLGEWKAPVVRTPRAINECTAILCLR